MAQRKERAPMVVSEETIMNRLIEPSVLVLRREERYDRSWSCRECGTFHDRDMNAAINIEREGRRINKIGLSSPDLKPLETDVRPKDRKVRGLLSVKKEKNVIQRFING